MDFMFWYAVAVVAIALFLHWYGKRSSKEQTAPRRDIK